MDQKRYVAVTDAAIFTRSLPIRIVIISCFGCIRSLSIRAALLGLLLLMRSRCISERENRAVSDPEKKPEKISRKNIMQILMIIVNSN
jgi:hypothetical protein